MTFKSRPAMERFLEKVDFSETGCWLWTGAKNTEGYGTFREGGKRSECRSVTAHVWLYIQLKGTYPPELDLDHLCRVRHCVNPNHLEPVTRRENVLRGVGPCAKKATQTHCKYGHPFDEENTRYRPEGGRACRECNRQVCKKWHQQHKPH